MKEFICNMYRKENFTKRLITVILAVIVMGFCLSWLVLVDMGTDPCTSFNLAVAAKLGMSLGNWQALLNIFLFLFVIFFDKESIGFGTLANMFLVGYSLDFFSWIWSMVLPAGLFDSMAVRILVLIPALAVFIAAAAVYMDVKLGTSPYDAIPFIISGWCHKVSFRVIRICFDVCVIILALCFDGKVGIVTIVMGFTLGPVIAFVGKKLNEWLKIA